MTDKDEPQNLVELQDRILVSALLTAVVRLIPLPAAPDGVIGAMRAYMVRSIGEDLGLKFPMGALLSRVTNLGPGALDIAYSFGRSVTKSLLGRDRPFREIIEEISPAFARTVFIGRELLEMHDSDPSSSGEDFFTHLDNVLPTSGRDLEHLSDSFINALDSMGDTGVLLIKEIAKNMAKDVGKNIRNVDPVALGVFIAGALPDLFQRSRTGIDIMISLLSTEVFDQDRKG